MGPAAHSKPYCWHSCCPRLLRALRPSLPARRSLPWRQALWQRGRAARRHRRHRHQVPARHLLGRHRWQPPAPSRSVPSTMEGTGTGTNALRGISGARHRGQLPSASRRRHGQSLARAHRRRRPHGRPPTAACGHRRGTPSHCASHRRQCHWQRSPRLSSRLRVFGRLSHRRARCRHPGSRRRFLLSLRHGRDLPPPGHPSCLPTGPRRHLCTRCRRRPCGAHRRWRHS